MLESLQLLDPTLSETPIPPHAEQGLINLLCMWLKANVIDNCFNRRLASHYALLVVSESKCLGKASV